MNEPVDTEIPLAVLVDGSTASASEIVSGSLQDLDRAIVVGSRTYGKGLVQVPRELPYNSSMKVTTASIIFPADDAFKPLITLNVMLTVGGSYSGQPDQCIPYSSRT